jgi:carboxyl-terminal processing protease
VQRNIPLNPQSENTLFGSGKAEDLGTVKLTLQKFYRINGGATQLEGVVPDVILPDRLEYLKFREKDNPDALKWDKISQAPYKTWTSTYSTAALIKNANESVSNSPAFEKIKTNVQWLEKNSDRSFSLNIQKFKEDQKKLKSVYKDIDDAYKLSKAIDMKYLDGENVADENKDKNDRSKQWLKVRSEDVFIDKTVKVVNSMITQTNLAKTN